MASKWKSVGLREQIGWMKDQQQASSVLVSKLTKMLDNSEERMEALDCHLL